MREDSSKALQSGKPLVNIAENTVVRTYDEDVGITSEMMKRGAKRKFNEEEIIYDNVSHLAGYCVIGSECSSCMDNRHCNEACSCATMQQYEQQESNYEDYYPPQGQEPGVKEEIDMNAARALLLEQTNMNDTYIDPIDGGRYRKKRKKKTAEQLSELEKEFSCNPLPSKDIREQLGDSLGLSAREVQVWFQNRRAKVKKTGPFQGGQFDYNDNMKDSTLDDDDADDQI